MPNDPSHGPGKPESPQRNYENRDPSFRGVLITGGGIALLLVLSMASVSLLFQHFSRTRPAGSPPHGGAMVAPDDTPFRAPPGPQLQVNPPLELEALRARESNELNSYGWINRDAGVVRIPVHRAMGLLLERGLPAREAHQPVPVGKSSFELLQERSQAP